MDKLARYLEEAYIEQLTSELTAQGYAVRADDHTEPAFDLLATRDSETIAIKVIAFSQIKHMAKTINMLRQARATRGFTDFRLVVAHHLHEKRVEVENLPELLTEYRHQFSVEQLIDFPGRVSFDKVRSAEIDKLEVKAGKIIVEGKSSVVADLVFMGNEQCEPFTVLGDRYGFSFRLTLNHDMQVVPKESMVERIDTSDVFEDMGIERDACFA